MEELEKEAREGISKIFSKWWEGEKINRAYRGRYYDFKQYIERLNGMELKAINSGNQRDNYLEIYYSGFKR